MSGHKVRTVNPTGIKGEGGRGDAAQKEPKKARAKSAGVSGIEGLFSSGLQFLQSLKNSERVLLVHHSDVDGYCSGALFIKALQVISVDIKFELNTIAAANEEMEYFLKSGKAGTYDKVIVLDIDIPYLRAVMENLKGRMLIIDHHSVRSDMNSDRVVYINPRLFRSEIYQPASYIVYKFLRYVAESIGHKRLSSTVERMEWVAVFGTVSDFAYEDVKDLLGGWMNAKCKNDILNTDFWEASKVFYGALIANDGDERGNMQPLLESKKLSELMSNRVVLELYNKFSSGHEKAKKQFSDNSETVGDIIFSKISPEFKRVGSVIATDAGIRKSDKTIILLEERGDSYKVHARCQEGCVNLGEVMNKCCTSGGGHRHAAGGTIKSKDYEKFKRCVVDEIRKSRKDL